MAKHTNAPSALIKAAAIAAMPEMRRVHPLNSRAVRQTKSLGDAVGMTDLGVHLVHVKPGDETTEYHTHYCDEEFMYILSGRGIAEIGSSKVEVAAGDFMGFTAKSEPHTMSNPYDEALIYLLGGTRKAIDISEYPRSRTRAYKFDGKRHTVKFDDVKES
jgi:uncharacterized cupin superfamily protein